MRQGAMRAPLWVSLTALLVACGLQSPWGKSQDSSTSAAAAGVRECGDTLGAFNGVAVHYNDGLDSCGEGRHRSPSGYSYGKRWQCVEYVRRYYEQALGHEMPEMYGHAKDYFRAQIPHGAMNTERNLIQFKNGGTEKPQPSDLVVFPEMVEGYGHVAIVTQVGNGEITVIQQNLEAGPLSVHKLVHRDGRWTIADGCAGFLRRAP